MTFYAYFVLVTSITKSKITSDYIHIRKQKEMKKKKRKLFHLRHYNLDVHKIVKKI